MGLLLESYENIAWKLKVLKFNLLLYEFSA